MSYNIGIDRLKSSINFIDRDIEDRCAAIRELLACEEERKALEARREQIDRQVGLLFEYGGEQIERRDPVAGETERLAKKTENCRRELSDFEGDYREYLDTAKFLAKQAERILDPEDSRLLMSVEEPQKLCPELMKWNSKNVDQALLVKALLLQTFLRGCTPGTERRALASVSKYLEHADPECYADAEKKAFLAVIPYLTLKGILHKIGAEKGNFEEDDRQRMEEALRKVPLASCAYPALLSCQNIFQAGFMESEELLLLGNYYEYFSGEEPDGERYARAWITCFGKALYSKKYHHFLGEFLSGGFGKFLHCYDGAGRKCLGDVFEKCLKRGTEGLSEQKMQEKSDRAEEILQEYMPLFSEKVHEYLREKSFVEEVTEALLKQSATGSLPSVRKLNMGYLWEGERDAWQELSLRCIADIGENWRDKNLNPSFWDAEWIDAKIREMCREQSKNGGDTRGSKKCEKVMFRALPLLGILMGLGRIGCYTGAALLACIMFGEFVPEKPRRSLLIYYSMYLITSVGGYLLKHETTLFYFLWAWSRPSVGVGRKIMILLAAVIIPVLFYIYVQRQTKKLRKEGETA